MLFALQFTAPVLWALLIDPFVHRITKQLNFFTQLEIHYRTSLFIPPGEGFLARRWPGLHTQRGVQANGFAIDIPVVHNVFGQRREFCNVPQARRIGNIFGQALFHFR